MAAMSFGRRVAFAFRCFFALLFKGIVPSDIVEVVAPSAPLGAAARHGRARGDGGLARGGGSGRSR